MTDDKSIVFVTHDIAIELFGLPAGTPVAIMMVFSMSSAILNKFLD